MRGRCQFAYADVISCAYRLQTSASVPQQQQHHHHHHGTSVPMKTACQAHHGPSDVWSSRHRRVCLLDVKSDSAALRLCHRRDGLPADDCAVSELDRRDPLPRRLHRRLRRRRRRLRRRRRHPKTQALTAAGAAPTAVVPSNPQARRPAGAQMQRPPLHHRHRFLPRQRTPCGDLRFVGHELEGKGNTHNKRSHRNRRRMRMALTAFQQHTHTAGNAHVPLLAAV